jgi:hypothetical protein
MFSSLKSNMFNLKYSTLLDMYNNLFNMCNSHKFNMCNSRSLVCVITISLLRLNKLSLICLTKLSNSFKIYYLLALIIGNWRLDWSLANATIT